MRVEQDKEITMPGKKGLTAKQEAFVLEFMETGNQSEAYRRAYDVGENTKPSTIWVKACELMANGNVAERVYELQQAAQERTLVTVQSITQELDEARDMARKQENPTAMTTSIMGKAKVNGLLIDRVDQKQSVRVVIDREDADL